MANLPKQMQEALIQGRTQPVVFIEVLLGVRLHDGQKKFIQLFVKFWLAKAPRTVMIFILTCANRWGKSVTIACIQCWFLFYKIGIPDGDDDAWLKTEYRTANIAPHSALTEPVFKTLHQILTSTFSIRDPKTGKISTNKCLIEWWYLQDRTLNTPPYKQYFDNNSYIEHRSLGADQGDSLQGKPFGLVTYDEGGRSDHLENEINDAILPRLFDWQAPLMVLSTPSQDAKSTGHYYQMFENGMAGLDNTITMTGSLRDNTFFSSEQIDAQYDLLKDNPLRDQILEGKFVFGGNTLYNLTDVTDAKDENLNETIPYQDGHTYAFGTDTAIGSDEMVYTILDITTKPYRQVNKMAAKGNSKSPQAHLHDFLELFDHYNQGRTLTHLLETWNGESVRFYHDLPPYVQAVTQCYGSWQPDMIRVKNDNPEKPTPANAKKADILINLKKLLSAKEIKYPKNDQTIFNQLSSYREDDTRLKTDHVMSLALAAFLAEQNAPQSPIEFVTFEW